MYKKILSEKYYRNTDVFRNWHDAKQNCFYQKTKKKIKTTCYRI